MPRVGLSTADVVAAGAALADEQGIDAVSFAALAARLGVRPPALYNHVDGVADLRRRIATVAMTELGDALRDALQGKSQEDAIAALLTTMQAYVSGHPGRYAATTGQAFTDEEDALFHAASRVMASSRAVLEGYEIPPADLDHAVRTLRCLIHGYASLLASDGFQWNNDPDATLVWMGTFVDAGLRAVAVAR